MLRRCVETVSSIEGASKNLTLDRHSGESRNPATQFLESKTLDSGFRRNDGKDFPVLRGGLTHNATSIRDPNA